MEKVLGMVMLNSLAETVREQLVPLLSALCKILEKNEEAAAWLFFHQIQVGLEIAEQEAEIGNFVIELSASAFLGFNYSDDALLILDQVLDRAIQIADTMSAGTAPH